MPEDSKSDGVNGELSWPHLEDDHPLAQLSSQLNKVLEEVEYDEVYGIALKSASDFHRKLICQKFIRANYGDLEKAREQLVSTLKWRKSYQPSKAKDEDFDRSRFFGLGYVTVLNNVKGSENTRDVITFNIYGAVTDNRHTFGDLEGFLRWRVALMELSLAKLDLQKATKPIPDYGHGLDPYQCIQVHDYMNVSFLRQDPHAKAAANEAIKTFSAYYPETLSRKFFVNVPVIMGWLFSAMKLILSKETVRKFTVLTYGKDLAGELGSSVPAVYGGSGGHLETMGDSLKMDSKIEQTPQA